MPMGSSSLKRVRGKKTMGCDNTQPIIGSRFAKQNVRLFLNVAAWKASRWSCSVSYGNFGADPEDNRGPRLFSEPLFQSLPGLDAQKRSAVRFIASRPITQKTSRSMIHR